MFDEVIIMYFKVNTNYVIPRVMYRTEKINKKFFQSIKTIMNKRKQITPSKAENEEEKAHCA
jgi:hypothetical protein